METVQQNGRFTLFLVNSPLIYILFSLALLYTYNCLIYYRLGQNQLILNKYAVLSRYSLWPITISNGLAYDHSIQYNHVGFISLWDD